MSKAKVKQLKSLDKKKSNIKKNKLPKEVKDLLNKMKGEGKAENLDKSYYFFYNDNFNEEN